MLVLSAAVLVLVIVIESTAFDDDCDYEHEHEHDRQSCPICFKTVAQQLRAPSLLGFCAALPYDATNDLLRPRTCPTSSHRTNA